MYLKNDDLLLLKQINAQISGWSQYDTDLKQLIRKLENKRDSQRARTYAVVTEKRLENPKYARPKGGKN